MDYLSRHDLEEDTSDYGFNVEDKGVGAAAGGVARVSMPDFLTV